jgi:regulator of RNase E activity RraA
MLTSVLVKHGLGNVCIRKLHKINKGAPRLVGSAYTLRHIPAREGIFGLYPPEAEAEQAFREWRRKKGR